MRKDIFKNIFKDFLIIIILIFLFFFFVLLYNVFWIVILWLLSLAYSYIISYEDEKKKKKYLIIFFLILLLVLLCKIKFIIVDKPTYNLVTINKKNINEDKENIKKNIKRKIVEISKEIEKNKIIIRKPYFTTDIVVLKHLFWDNYNLKLVFPFHLFSNKKIMWLWLSKNHLKKVFLSWKIDYALKNKLNKFFRKNEDLVVIIPSKEYCNYSEFC